MPTYNEADNLERICAHLLSTVAHVDALVVDDASPDGTGALADRLAAADPRVHVLHRPRKDGLGRAYLAGFAWARAENYQVVVEMDADGSHPAETLPVMLDALVSGATAGGGASADFATAAARGSGPGLVIGSRWIPGGSVLNWPRRRLWLSRWANIYARLALGIPVRDVTAGYRVYPIDVATELASDADSHGYSFQIEMVLRVFEAGYSIVEVPIVFREREAGASKMSRGVVLEATARVTRWGLQRLLFRRRHRIARTPSPEPSSPASPL
jgi:dolichol-phosphate mannosyltransferase